MFESQSTYCPIGPQFQVMFSLSKDSLDIHDIEKWLSRYTLSNSRSIFAAKLY